ncbi:HD-GYP domain-containing protein [Gorillibacterium sp. sgz5001074]|uniref:HD-GYP domain-containing protein n=1 Tax=Gorillibacterium sp. sgz5001074 TaxID=3446695 RepID=UPI003F66F53C
MHRRSIAFLAGPACAILLPLLVYFGIKINPSWDPLLDHPEGHFYIVSFISVLAACIALTIGLSARRLRNIKLVFLSLSFLSMGGIFAVHGLSTPGFIMQPSHMPAVSAQVSVLIAAVWLWMSSLPTDNPLLRHLSSRINVLVPVWFWVLVLMGAASMAFPHMADSLPLNQNPLKWIATGMTILFCGLVIFRYLQGFRYARLPLQMSIVYSACWLSVAQIIMATGSIWRLSWWLYHYVLLAAMIVMIGGFLRHSAAGVRPAQIFKALFTRDPKERIEACISPSVKSLVVATESRDTYTAGHNFRVAMYALRLGEEMNLSPEQLRALAQGTVVHDVGKIQIPDAILNKPGRLTSEERAIIETHPVVGYEMCKRVGFMKEELDVIRHHHERWDGAGYPDRIAGSAIPLLARITAVADVYDALTSTRSYRVAWTHEAAMEHLEAGAGTQFDPVCVEAWAALCRREPEAYLEPSRMQTETVKPAKLASGG